MFREVAPRFGVMPTITEAAVSEANIELVAGNRCISVGHKTHITNDVLLALSQAGVMYISTRSIGYNHIDVEYAESVGISVENVEYSSDSVADYTLMLMLMVVRNAKSIIGRADIHDYRSNDVRGKELRDLTIGVIGTGRIGTAVIDRLFTGLPEIVRALATPLSKIDKITVVSTGNGEAAGMHKITGDLTKMAAQVPALFEALSGMQISELLSKVRQIGDKPSNPKTPELGA